MPCLVAPSTSSVCRDPFHCPSFSGLTNSFLGLPRKCSASDPRVEKKNFVQVEETHFRLLPPAKRNPVLRFEAPSENNSGLAKSQTSFKVGRVHKANNKVDSFDEMKQRFLNFKKRVYLEELEHYHRLSEVQTPKVPQFSHDATPNWVMSCKLMTLARSVQTHEFKKQFMVIACADSRVCPSNILGFQPGEAFMIRNVANFVPPLENGPSETNAALEFAVNILQVENILIIGHSRCGGIETLMSMQDDVNSSFVHNWITKAKAAKFRTKVAAPHHSFEQQCRHCEKESVNISLLNLLTYPWIAARVGKNQLSVHGGYYDFLNCTFEKWTLDIKGSDIDGGRYLVKDQAFWS